MKELHDLKERLLDELKDYGKRDMTASNLGVIDTITHTIKNLCKIIEDEGYSGYYPHVYDGSYRNRDSMGRYSRTGLADKLKDLMADAPDDRTRMEIKRLIEKM